MRTERNERNINVLIIGTDKTSFSELSSTLEKDDHVHISWVASGGEALDLVPEWAFDLVVIEETLQDMTGLEFVKTLIPINPMINCAVVSSLPAEQFHEVSEGLGVLVRLPNQPGKKEAENLLLRLKGILNISAPKTG